MVPEVHVQRLSHEQPVAYYRMGVDVVLKRLAVGVQPLQHYQGGDAKEYDYSEESLPVYLKKACLTQDNSPESKLVYYRPDNAARATAFTRRPGARASHNITHLPGGGNFRDFNGDEGLPIPALRASARRDVNKKTPRPVRAAGPCQPLRLSTSFCRPSSRQPQPSLPRSS